MTRDEGPGTVAGKVRHTWWRAGLLIALLAVGYWYRARTLESRPKLVATTGVVMGTVYHVKAVTPRKWTPRQLDAVVLPPLRLVDARMSTYRADSDLARIAAAAAGTPVTVHPETAAVLRFARRVSAATDGAFDVTVGPLVRLWGFHDKRAPAALPTDAAIRAVLQRVGWRYVEVDPRRPAVVTRRAGVQVDLSAVAKGRAVDLVARALDKRGFRNYMVEVGGEVRCRGKNARGQWWRIGVERPQEDGVRQVERVVALRNRAMATSGDYRSFFEKDGVRYAHTIDPRTGRPVAHPPASVSVVAPTCMEADAWATALTVLGVQAGMEVAEKRRMAVYFLWNESGALRSAASSRFAALLRSTQEER